MILSDVEEMNRRDLTEQSKPIDATKLNPGHIQEDHKTTEAMPESEQRTSTMMKIYIDEEGYVTFPDGSRYKGGLYGGIPDGEGRIIYTDGSTYDGEWRSGNSHGQGTLRFPDGSFYEGNWSRGKYHGRGAYVTKMNAKYDGEW